MRSVLTMALDLTGQTVTVVGGGRVAEHKVGLCLAAGAQVRVISPTITAGLRALAEGGQVEFHARPFAAGDTRGAMLVVAATGRPDTDAAVAAEAKGAGLLVSVSGNGRLGNALFTAEVRRGPVSIAVSTGGASPALTRRLCQEVARVIGPEYGALAELLAEVRERVSALKGLAQSERARIYAEIADGPALQLLSEGRPEAARALADRVIRAYAGAE